jgi:phosphate transport system substrate-binding protein
MGIRLTHIAKYLIVSALMVSTANAANITGAGATFPYPIYAKWADAYRKETGIGLNYQSIGSGGGIKQIRARTVDFGASDAPLKPDELARDGLMQFPAIIGGVVPIVNIKGVAPGQLRLSGKVLADIFLGKIKRWNDEAIAGLNPGLSLPSKKITVVRRADGSGTTFLFTDYLSQMSKEWTKTVGHGKAVAWPSGVGGKGNEGVAAYVQRIKGSIGYVEFAYAKKNKMGHVLLQNRAGKYVAPSAATFSAAAANANWTKAPGFYLVLTNQPGEGTWPITGASFIIVYKQPEKPERVKEALKFYSWAFKKGGPMADKLDYVAMPASVVKTIEKAWAESIKDKKGAPIWN